MWHALQDRALRKSSGGLLPGTESFLRQLGWREFAHHLLFHFPKTAERPLRPEFARFPWARSPKDLAAWREGRSGYPMVDAGMRELLSAGWMHNRVRMVAASFLVKDLRVHWLEGARWFWDTLVDADLANNTLGWQWAAGCGADAAPYFRVFNPARQGRRFDPEGGYVRRWVPELSALSAAWIHDPEGAPTEALERAEVRIGTDYPAPVVEHAEARERALAALATLKRGK
jgi:deoxyribodipyrimidine photo-lyase